MKRPAVFLDRDGTINVDKDYLYRIEDFEYLPGVVDALRELSEMQYRLIIITNQSGIARGYYTEEDYQRLMGWMIADLKEKGAIIDGHYFCPHLPGAAIKKYDRKCACRKPGTGLFSRAIDELGIAPSRSFAIGDKLRDLAICRESDVKGILLGTKEIQDEVSFSYVRCKDWDEIMNYVRANAG